MPIYKILGIYSFAENIKDIKLNDSVILKNEKYNIKSKNAIGVYTIDNKKIGYISNENELDKSTYKISKMALSQEYPLIEIKKDYPQINYLDNVEYPYEKKIKYEYKSINISEEIKNKIIGLENYLLTKKIKVKRSAVIYYDDYYINILIEPTGVGAKKMLTNKSNLLPNEYSKYIKELQIVTLKYYNENKDRYEELYENKLIDIPFYRDLLINRLECYYEENYTHVLDYLNNQDNLDDLDNKFTEEKIHNDLDISIIECKIYIKNLINNKNNIISYNLINEFVSENKLRLGKFTYDHKLKIYDYIDFVNDDTVFVISDTVNKNYIYSAYLMDKENLIIYNPINGIINKR